MEENNLNKKNFWILIESDYRSGPIIEMLAEPNDECCGSIEFELPVAGRKFYIVNEYPNYEVVWSEDLGDESGKKLYLKLFSQIHDSMPFEFTGMICSEGYYPPVPEKIKNRPEIAKKIVETIIDNPGDYYFVCVLNSEGLVSWAEVLQPIC